VLPALQLSGVAFNDEAARFELTVWVEETDTGLSAVWTYSTDLFDAPAIRRMQSHYEQLLYAVAAQPSTLIDNLEMRTAAEMNQHQRREQELTSLSYKKFIDVKPKPVAV
jgi:non-ribosomal peptide synthetase component F